MTLAFWLGRGNVTCATAATAQLKKNMTAKKETELRLRELMIFLLVMVVWTNHTPNRPMHIRPISSFLPIMLPLSARIFSEDPIHVSPYWCFVCPCLLFFGFRSKNRGAERPRRSNPTASHAHS